MVRNVTAAEHSLDYVMVGLGLIATLIGVVWLVQYGAVWPVHLLAAFMVLGGALIAGTGATGITRDSASALLILLVMEVVAAVIAVVLVLFFGIL
jgi:hypothetical protein